MSIQRFENEDFLTYAERLISRRQDYDLDKVEIFELLYGEQVSPDHARKCLTNLERTIEESKKYNIGKQIHKDLNDVDLQTKKNTIELNKDGSQTSEKLIEMSNEEAKDVNFLLKSHGYDIKCWELVSARNNIWNVYSKQDGIQTLYSSKIVVKPRTEYVWNAEDIEKLFNSLNLYSNKKDIIPKQYEENGNILFVPIADFHYGLNSDILSTGNEYNIQIAEELYRQVLSDVVTRIEGKRFEKVVFVVGNDFINSDNLSNTTTKGTPQDTGISWFTLVESATKLIVDGIDILKNIAPVDVQFVPSNHDLHTMFGIMQTIKAHYRNCSNITVDTSPLPRKYYKFGTNLIALSHNIKVKDALKLISTEGKSDWSSCNHVYCILAHLHEAMEYEKQGYVEVRRLPTISGWSRWTNNRGYVQTEKKNQTFIINKDKGMTDILNTILD